MGGAHVAPALRCLAQTSNELGETARGVLSNHTAPLHRLHQSDQLDASDVEHFQRAGWIPLLEDLAGDGDEMMQAVARDLLEQVAQMQPTGVLQLPDSCCGCRQL